MATQVTLPTSTRVPAVITIRVRQPMLMTLREMSVLATLPLELLAAQLLEAQIVAFRARKIPADFLVRKDKDADESLEREPERSKRLLSPLQIQKLFFLADSGEGLGVKELARRFGVGASTVRRYLSHRKKLTPSGWRGSGCPKSGFNG